MKDKVIKPVRNFVELKKTLKNCPLCKSKNIYLNNMFHCDGTPEVAGWVACGDCGITIEKMTLEEAVKFWNNRQSVLSVEEINDIIEARTYRVGKALDLNDADLMKISQAIHAFYQKKLERK